VIELAAPENPAVSVIVLLDGAVELAERCLLALAACEDSVPFETVLFLNAPDAELEAFVRDSTRGGRVVLCRANAGPGAGWNLGAEAARGPLLATLHEDSQPHPDWLPPLLAALEEDGAGAVGSRLYHRDGSIQNCGWVLFSDASGQQITSPEAVAASSPTPVDMLSGAAMLIDREALRAVGGWDERFHPAVFVDVDACTALWNLGLPVLSVPSSRVVHETGAFDRRGHSPLTGPRLREFLFLRNQAPFLEKWGELLAGGGEPPDYSRMETVPTAIAEAWELTKERARRLASGGWSPPCPAARPERRLTGLVEQPLVPDGANGLRVAPAIERALDEAEAGLIRDYCLWLVHREEWQAGRLGEAEAALEECCRDRGGLQRSFEEMQRSRNEAAEQLAQVLNGRTWRLRSAVLRLLRRGG
jgi:GT2 family glycosyltransferase